MRKLEPTVSADNAESYSRSVVPRTTFCLFVPRATPGLLHRELLPVCCTESYSRSVAPRATPGLLPRELLPVCCPESYSQSGAPRATPGLLHRELLPVCGTESYSRSVAPWLYCISYRVCFNDRTAPPQPTTSPFTISWCTTLTTVYQQPSTLVCNTHDTTTATVM